MADPTTEFFDGLSRRGYERLLEEASGTIRFDLAFEHGVDRWFLVIRRGDLRVSREEPEADCVIRTSRAFFDRLVSGEGSIYAAWARNEILATGDIRLARLIQRVLPGPPDARDPRMPNAERRRPA